MDIRPSKVSDRAHVERLVAGAGLPREGLADQFPDAYWVAVEKEDLIGCVGIERYGNYGLLRSLAVAEYVRGKSIGSALLARAMEEAVASQLDRLYLLTTTASGFFRRHGFVDEERVKAPVAIQQSPEFASICPSSASCLVWRPAAK